MSVREERFCDLWESGRRCSVPATGQCSVCGRDYCYSHAAKGTIALSFNYSQKAEVTFPLCKDCRDRFHKAEHFKVSTDVMQEFEALRDAVVAYLKLPAAEKRAIRKKPKDVTLAKRA